MHQSCFLSTITINHMLKRESHQSLWNQQTNDNEYYGRKGYYWGVQIIFIGCGNNSNFYFLNILLNLPNHCLYNLLLCLPPFLWPNELWLLVLLHKPFIGQTSSSKLCKDRLGRTPVYVMPYFLHIPHKDLDLLVDFIVCSIYVL